MRYLFGDCTLDTNRRELHRGAQLLPVEPQVFDLLEYLIRNRDSMVSKDDLLAAVWGGRIVSDSTLNSRIKAARAAIGDNGEEQRLIRTLIRKGFRFVGTVQEAHDGGELAPAAPPASRDLAPQAIPLRHAAAPLQPAAETPPALRYAALTATAAAAAIAVLSFLQNNTLSFAGAIALVAVSYWFVYRKLAADVVSARTAALGCAFIGGYFALANVLSIYQDPTLPNVAEVWAWSAIEALGAGCLIYVFVGLNRPKRQSSAATPPADAPKA